MDNRVIWGCPHTSQYVSHLTKIGTYGIIMTVERVQEINKLAKSLIGCIAKELTPKEICYESER